MDLFSIFLLENSEASLLIKACLKSAASYTIDETPFLIFADWLQENGDEDLSNFTRAVVYRRRNVKGQKAQHNRTIKSLFEKINDRSRLIVTGRIAEIYFKDNNDLIHRYSYFPTTKHIQVTRPYVDRYVDEYPQVNIPGEMILRYWIIRDPDWPGDRRLREPSNPDNPANWPVPFMGELITPDYDMLLRIFIGVVVYLS